VLLGNGLHQRRAFADSWDLAVQCTPSSSLNEEIFEMPYPKGYWNVGPRSWDRCSEFVCQSCQKLLLGAVFANRSNLRINNLWGIRGLRTNESLFLRQCF